MDDGISKVNNKYIDSIDAEMLAKDNNIEYYKCNNKNSTFKVPQNNGKETRDEELMINLNSSKIEESKVKNGEIVVTSVCECEKNKYLQGIKINLYKINGLSPVLIESKTTDEEGKVVFSEVEEGCYRIIEIVDKRYFEKPKYINWNEIIIDSVNKNQKLTIVNRIKKSCITR